MLTSMRELGAPQGSLLVASRTYQTTQSVQKKRNQNGNQSFPNFQRLGSRHQNKHIPLPPFPSFGIPLVEKTIELDNVFS